VDEASSLFVYVFPSPGVDPAITANVSVGLMSGVDHTKYQVVDLDKRFGGQEEAAKELAEADAAVVRAFQLLNELEIQAADTALELSVQLYEKHLVGLLARDGGLSKLAQAHAARAVARFLDGDEENAAKLLHRAFVSDPEVASLKLFPPEMAPMVARERLRFEELGTGSLEVVTPGVAAQAIVNGQDAAMTPAHFDDLPVGISYVTLSAQNRPTITVTVAIEPDETSRVVQEIPVYRGDPLAAVHAAEDEVGRKTIGDKLREAGRSVGDPDRMLLATTAPSQDGVLVTVYLYDMRTASLVGRNEGDAVLEDPTPAAEKLTRALMTAEPEIVVGRGVRDTSPPIWERSWFWPAVGVGAAVVVTGVLVGLAASGGLSDAERVVIFGVTF
jgi:hypothetical protein